MRPTELDDLIAAQAGVVTWAQATAHLSPSALKYRVNSGRWQRAHRGVYVCHSGVLTDLDVNLSWSPPATRPARSLVDAAQWARSDDTARAILFAGMQQGIVHGTHLHQVLERLPRARRRSLIAEAADDGIGGVRSLPESALGRLLRRHHLPRPTRQAVRLDADGRRRYLDAYFDEWHLHIEVDGAQHMEVRQWWADMDRQNRLWIAGDRVLRRPAGNRESCGVRATPMAATPQDLGKGLRRVRDAGGVNQDGEGVGDRVGRQGTAVAEAETDGSVRHLAVAEHRRVRDFPAC
jgi:hypothetical protein